MKCPIKKLEFDCIGAECPFCVNNSCDLGSVLFSISTIERVADTLDSIETNLKQIGEVLYMGVKRL